MSEEKKKHIKIEDGKAEAEEAKAEEKAPEEEVPEEAAGILACSRYLLKTSRLRIRQKTIMNLMFQSDSSLFHRFR